MDTNCHPLDQAPAIIEIISTKKIWNEMFYKKANFKKYLK